MPAPKVAYWEAPGRNPLIPAFVMVGLVGGLFALVGSIAANAWILVDLGVNGRSGWASSGGSYLENLKATYEHFQVPILILNTIFQFAFFLGLTTFIFKRWHGLAVPEYFRIRSAHPLAIVLSIAGAILLIPLATASAELFLRAFPILKELGEVENALVAAPDPGRLILVLLTVGLTPAICEEFLFRGYFHRTLARRIRQPYVYLVSGTVFALIHQNYFGLIALIAAGVWLGFVFHRFDSIFASSATHFTYNSVLIIMANFPGGFRWLNDSDGLMRWEAVVVSAAGLGLLIFAMIRLSPRLIFRPPAPTM